MERARLPAVRSRHFRVQQNIPAQFSPGSESGFILPVAGSNTAGLADFGTRLKATFNNVPSGINIFVTTTNINPLGNTGVPANTPTNTALLGGALNNIPVGNAIYAACRSGAERDGDSRTGRIPPAASNTNNNSGLLTFGPSRSMRTARQQRFGKF